jgi:phage terminase small subunit
MEKSALTAGYSEITANCAGSLIEGQPGIRAALDALLRERAPNEELANTLVAGLKATKRFSKEIVDPDFKERREAVKLIAQLTKQLEPEVTTQTQYNMNIINVGA